MKKSSGTILAECFEESELKIIFEERISLGKAVGRDGMTARRYVSILDQEVKLIRSRVLSNSYKFTQYRALLASKGPGKAPRVLSVPTVRDRITQRALLNALQSLFPNSRTKKPHFYISEINQRIRSTPGELYFARVDVKEFYPSINVDKLMRIIRRKIRDLRLLNLIRLSLFNETTGKFDSGIPQGLSISNILSYIYMQDMDAHFQSKFQYYRYVDDILIVSPSHEDAVSAIMEVAKTLKNKRNLTCHEIGEHGKTEVRTLTEGIDYLGYHLKREMVSVRKSSYREIMNRLVSRIIHHARSAGRRDDVGFLWRLNLRITGCVFNGTHYGWVFFFSQTENKNQLGRIDKLIRKTLRDHNLGHLCSAVRSVFKAHHEVRFNRNLSTYFPRFDTFNEDHMINTIAIATGTSKVVVRGWNPVDIRRMFREIVSREVMDMEEDLLNALY